MNPLTEAAAFAGYPQQKTFLTSAVARPYNSGGPIVVQGGRVITTTLNRAIRSRPQLAMISGSCNILAKLVHIGPHAANKDGSYSLPYGCGCSARTRP